MPSGSPDPPEDRANPSNISGLSRMVTARHHLHGNNFHSLSRFRSSRSIWCSFPPGTSPDGGREEDSLSETWCPDSAEESLIFLSFHQSLPKYKEALISFLWLCSSAGLRRRPHQSSLLMEPSELQSERGTVMSWSFSWTRLVPSFIETSQTCTEIHCCA